MRLTIIFLLKFVFLLISIELCASPHCFRCNMMLTTIFLLRYVFSTLFLLNCVLHHILSLLMSGSQLYFYRSMFFSILFRLRYVFLEIISHDVMVKALDGGIGICEFELQSRYVVHFRTNTLLKGMNVLILSVRGKIVPLLFFYDLAFSNPRKLICH